MDLKDLQKRVLRAAKNSYQNGFEFLYLKCGKNLQALVLPPALRQTTTKRPAKDKLFNINIVLLDSISRPHFYRVLPKSVLALRQIANDDSIPATALDFELYQSVGQNTFDNLRPLFSGVRKGEGVCLVHASNKKFY